MARKENRTRRERFGGPPKGYCTKGCYIDDEYRKSEALARLNGTELLLLMGFLSRRRYNQTSKRNKTQPKYTNLLDIVYTLDCMTYETHASKQTVLAARQKLLDLGFIELLDQTNWGNHSNNRYGISERYRKWHPDQKIRDQNGFVPHKSLRKKKPTNTSYKKKLKNELAVVS